MLWRKRKPISVTSNTGEFDPLSPTWRHVAEYCERQIEALRTKNESMALSETDTAAIRGKIKAYKAIMNMAGKPA